jgi:thioredoxin-related protein
MRPFIFITLSFCQLSCSSVMRAADTVPGPSWIRDFNDGQRKAREEKKDLLVVFTGHGWCYNCELLDREVFQKPIFVQGTGKSFVFVELDFTFGDSGKERQRERVYRDVQKRYLAPAVPTVFLVDQQGAPYAILEGYKSGTGPQRMLVFVEQARAARTERDRNFAAAGKSVGHERAELLHAGLQAVAPLLGSLEDRGDDPVLAFYPTVVAEIRQLDSGDKSPLTALYDARQKKRDEWIAVRDSTLGKLREFDKTKNYKGAIAFIDTALKEFKAPDVRWRLETARQIYFEWDSQYAAGLENARRLLADANRTPEDREWLLGRESYNLWNSGRVDEALAQHDRRIHGAQSSPKKRLQMLGDKAQMLLSHRKQPGVKPAEGIKAWREYREAAKPKTEDWLSATMYLAFLLQQHGDYREALNLQREFIEADPTNLRIRLFAAESHAALGETEAAREMIREVEKALPVNSERQGDKTYEKMIRAHIARIQDRLAKQTK